MGYFWLWAKIRGLFCLDYGKKIQATLSSEIIIMLIFTLPGRRRQGTSGERKLSEVATP
jgi:hypothetical protein